MKQICLLTIMVLAFAVPVPGAENGAVSFWYDSSLRELVLNHSSQGVLLSTTLAEESAGELSAQDKVFKITGADKSETILSLDNQSLVVDGAEDTRVVFDSALTAGRASPCFAKSQQEEIRGVLVTRLGPAAISGAKSLFDPQRDLVLTADAKKVDWTLDKTWKLELSGDATIAVVADYYKKELDVPHCTPFRKRSFWKTPPVVALTWYSLGIDRGHTFEEIKPEVDWISAHLLPYAERFVFQLDDNYNYKDDQWMRMVSDYIRSKGLVPGIWFAPFSVAPYDVYVEHPQWFLKNNDGEVWRTFSGKNWKWRAFGRRNTGTSGGLDVSQEGAVEQWYAPWWKKVSETWNYDYFKIDGMKPTLDCYGKVYGDEKAMLLFRKGLQIGRDIVGPDKFINACNQTPVQVTGICDGSRTGADALDAKVRRNPSSVVFAWNYLNNYTLWCDADAVIMQYRRSPEQVRYHSLCRAMTGQQFITDDKWSEMPPENETIWQRCFPGLDIYPVNLYAGDHGYDLLDLRIAKPWGTYDVVALLNRSFRHAGTRTMQISRLPVQGEKFHIYDFWDRKYLGVQGTDYQWSAELMAHEAKLFSIVPVAADGRPTLISTSRHFSQGGLDMERLEYRRNGDAWTVDGQSSHLVKGDRYELVFATEKLKAVKASAGDLELSITGDGDVTRVSVVPEVSGSLEWTVEFSAK